MKRLSIVLCMGLLVTGMVCAQASKGGTMYAAAKTVSLKSSTWFFATTRGTLNYGDKVTVLQISGNYAEVRSAVNTSLTGWTSTANLSAKQIVSGNTSSASAKEVALAGKGFNQEVENSYKSQGNLNYADVDKVETASVNEADLLKFMEEGRLAMGEQQ